MTMTTTRNYYDLSYKKINKNKEEILGTSYEISYHIVLDISLPQPPKLRVRICNFIQIKVAILAKPKLCKGI